MVPGTPFLIEWFHEWGDGITWWTSGIEDFKQYSLTLVQVATEGGGGLVAPVAAMAASIASMVAWLLAPLTS